MKGLRVGEATVTLRFWSDEEGESHHEVVEKEGKLRVVVQPPLDALNVGVWDRLGALAESVLPF